MLVLVANQFCPTRLYFKPRSRKQDYRKLLVNIDPSALPLMYRIANNGLGQSYTYQQPKFEPNRT